MPEETNIQIKQRSVMLFAAAIMLGVLGILSFVFHISPNVILEYLAEFSKHHYFTASIIFLIAAVVIVQVARKNVREKERTSTWFRPKEHMRAIRRSLKFAIKLKSHEGSFQFVSKTQLYAVRFFDEDVLTQENEKKRRESEINTAIMLGKQQRQKVVICFKTKGGEMYTIASLTAVFENDIVLDEGTKIPIKSIYKIEL
eukprot:gene3999-5726_t